MQLIFLQVKDNLMVLPLITKETIRIKFIASHTECEEPCVGLNLLSDGTVTRRVPFQDEDHPGNDPQLVPGFPRLCSGRFPELLRSASESVGSREIRLI